jgi:diacylglycerol kinase-like protein
MPERRVDTPALHPFLIMNPRSGGGKVGQFDLKRKAEDLGADVFLIEGPGSVDVQAAARRAVADGADLLGVAGGDGTQALVAGVAAEHGLPFVVITAGTRNHFALDLGLDRDDPAACLDALTDGVDLLVDLGAIGDQTFVNNASFGAYAEIVQTPQYRGDKLGSTPGPAPRPAQRPARDATHSERGRPGSGRATGGADREQPLRDWRPGRPRPPCTARPGGAGSCRHQRAKRPAGCRLAAPFPVGRTQPGNGDGSRHRRRYARHPCRHRR